MIELHQFPPAFGMRTMSPFGLKLEAYMRMAGIEYEVVFEADPRKGPKGKIPFVIDDGRRIGDSGFIVEHLVDKFGDKVDADLSPKERATGHVIRKTVEENLYFVVLHSRWVDERGWEVLSDHIRAGLPTPARLFVPLIRSSVIKRGRQQGMECHSSDEIYAIGKADLSALSTLLQDHPFYLGDRPHSVDAAVYGLVLGIYEFPADTPLRSHAESLKPLRAFIDRMTERLFSEDAG